MIPSTKRRLDLLHKFLEDLTSDGTTFILAGGDEFHTPLEADEYLVENGVFAPDGRRIVLCPHPVAGVDALSISLWSMVDQAIETGDTSTLDLRKLAESLESDEI